MSVLFVENSDLVATETVNNHLICSVNKTNVLLSFEGFTIIHNIHYNLFSSHSKELYTILNK